MPGFTRGAAALAHSAQVSNRPVAGSRFQAEGAREWLKGTGEAFGKREVPMRSVALAYYAFFTLFPLAVLAVAVLGYLVNIGAPLAADLQARMIGGLTDTLVGASDAVEGTLQNIGQSAGAIGLLGIAGLLWGLTGSLSAVSSAISRIFDPTAPLPSWKVRLRSAVVILGIGGIFALLSLGGVVLGLLAPFLSTDSAGPVIGAYRLVVQAVGPILTFGLLYKFLPTVPPNWQHALMGATAGGLLFGLLQLGFTTYLRFVSFDGVFGPLSGVAVLFVWLNFSSQAFLLGALVAARLRPEDPSPVVEGSEPHAPAGSDGIRPSETR